MFEKLLEAIYGLNVQTTKRDSNPCNSFSCQIREKKLS